MIRTSLTNGLLDALLLILLFFKVIEWAHDIEKPMTYPVARK